MAIVSGGFGVVKNSLIRNRDIKHLLKDEGCFSGADGKGHVEGQYKAENVLRVVDFSYVDVRFVWAGQGNFLSLE